MAAFRLTPRMSRSPHDSGGTPCAWLYSIAMTARAHSPAEDVLIERRETFSPRVLAAIWIVFWLLMIGASVQDALRNPVTSWWEPVLWEGSSALVASGFMLLAARVRRRYSPYLDRPLTWFGMYLRWLPIVSVVFIVTVYAIRHGVYASVGRIYEHPSWVYIFVYETVRLTLYACLWLGVLFGIDSHAQWRIEEHRLLQTRRALADAKLAQLQAQLRPHFLFNALNTVSALMHTDVDRADRLVATLGDLLRISLRSSAQEMTPLADELHTLELYADVMCERFRDRVTLAWDIDPAVRDTPVPVLLLQPLLENVFKHGVEGTVAQVAIVIRARREEDCLRIVVRNCGSSFAPGRRDGLGLRHCRERLIIIYGPAASLRVLDDGSGVSACVTIPLARAES
ncbi:MAG: Sensor histidine kinase YpdA [Luteibacter sp.]|nr:MAG: Sensor histidine kinase YpdA [Luteibacter sp.]